MKLQSFIIIILSITILGFGYLLIRKEKPRPLTEYDVMLLDSIAVLNKNNQVLTLPKDSVHIDSIETKENKILIDSIRHLNNKIYTANSLNDSLNTVLEAYLYLYAPNK